MHAPFQNLHHAAPCFYRYWSDEKGSFCVYKAILPVVLKIFLFRIVLLVLKGKYKSAHSDRQRNQEILSDTPSGGKGSLLVDVPASDLNIFIQRRNEFHTRARSG